MTPARRPRAHTRTTHRTTQRAARRLGLGLGLVGTLALALTGCSAEAEPELSVSGAYMPQPVTDTMAGGFMTVRNDGDEADKLTSVTSSISDKVEIHRTVGQKMEQVPSLTVPANGELKLSRGGNHLMLLDLERKPAEGDKVSVTLRFEKSDPVEVSVPVESTNYVPDAEDDGGK